MGFQKQEARSSFQEHRQKVQVELEQFEIESQEASTAIAPFLTRDF